MRLYSYWPFPCHEGGGKKQEEFLQTRLLAVLERKGGV